MPKKKQKHFNKDELNSIIKDYNNGMIPKQLSEKYNRDPAVIITKLQSIGIYKNSKNRWNNEEIKFLADNYSDCPWDILLGTLHRHKKEDIITKACKLKIRRNCFFWNKSDIEILKKYYNADNSIEDIRILLNNKFTISAINTKAYTLGFKKVFAWTDEEIAILKRYYENSPIEEIEKLLPNRNHDSIIHYANKKLGLINRNFWTDEEIKFISSNWTKMSDAQIADELNRTLRATIAKRVLIGLLRVSEEKSYNSIANYIRKNNNKWRMESMRKNNFKCYITNCKFDDIHHIHGFNLILGETFDNLQMEVKHNFNDYTDNELNIILSTFLHIQNTYPLGICLAKDVHKKFHKIYGYGNNTEEQWNDFLNKYSNKELKIA